MKELSLFLLSLLLLCGCSTRNEQEPSSTPQGEVIITGEVKNRDFYPHVKELVLRLPFFKEGQVTYTTDITEDNRFYFSFTLHAEMCEVAIKPYMEHLYVQPGDSIHLEIDFKDMLHPIVSGHGAELNEQMNRFTEGGYYMKDYNLWGKLKNNENFEEQMEKEHQERIRRYEEFVQKHQPSEKTKQYIGNLLKADYYTAWFFFQNRTAYEQKAKIDARPHDRKLKEAAALLESQVITDAHFRMSQEMHDFLHVSNEKFPYQIKDITPEEVLTPLKDTPALPYLYARSLSSSLYEQNDTSYFDRQKENFDRYIQSPYLRNSILQIHQSKKGFQENPKPVSDYLLYGRNQDQIKSQGLMPHMKPFYDLLEKHRGKMIYLDFWTPRCPPCLTEMEPLKELRKKYSTDDIVFIAICRDDSRERFNDVLNKYGMHVSGIEHIYATDLQDKDHVHKMYNQLNVHSIPHYFIINREGVIVNYGSKIRPSYPGTSECIDKWIEKRAK